MEKKMKERERNVEVCLILHDLDGNEHDFGLALLSAEEMMMMNANAGVMV